MLFRSAMYVFPNIKKTGLSSDEFSKKCLKEAGVALLPGNCFGEYGEGYARLCFVNSQNIIKEAITKLDQIF